MTNFCRSLCFAALLSVASGCAYAQATPATLPPEGAVTPESDFGPNCVLTGKTYTCSFARAHRAVHHAATVAIEVSPRDNAAQRQLAELISAFNKAVAPVGEADLIVSVLPVDNGGVIVGPADVDLATLRLYKRTTDGTGRALLWVETYRGQPDRPWPATVHALIEQFHKRFVHHA